MGIKRIALLILSILALIVSLFWLLEDQGFESVLAFIAGVAGLIQFFMEGEHRDAPAEPLHERNRRIMLNHVENFWIKGVLEKSLHGAALLELGIKEDPN